MSKDGLVTVLLPLFNQTNTLKEALESVLNQAYSYLELILLDDGSTDNPQKILLSYENSDPRLRYVTLKHRGLPATLNEGLQMAQGEFITWTSADNIMLPDMLSVLVTTLQETPELSATYAGYYHIDDQGLVTGQNPKGPYLIDPRPVISSRQREYLAAQMLGFGAAFLYRASACQQAGEFDPQCEGIEDVDYAVRLARVGPVKWVPKLLYKYRLHETSMSGRERRGEISFQKGRERFWDKLAALVAKESGPLRVTQPAPRRDLLPAQPQSGRWTTSRPGTRPAPSYKGAEGQVSSRLVTSRRQRQPCLVLDSREKARLLQEKGENSHSSLPD